MALGGLAALLALLPTLAQAQELDSGNPFGHSIGAQVGIQIKGVVFTILYSGALSAALFKVVDLVIGLRVTDEDEAIGLDLSTHNERGYVL